MAESQTEWEAQESQWQVEHEEEVRALRQRNSQLLKLLEDTRIQYQDYIEDQEREVAVIGSQATLQYIPWHNVATVCNACA